MTGKFWIVNSDHTLKLFKKHVDELYEKDKYIMLQWKTGKQRSLKQNSALHVWCQQVSDALNDSGQDMRVVLAHKADIPWTQQLVKEHIWKPVQESQIDEKSTAKAHKIDYVKVYEILNRYLAENLNITIPWPVHDGNS